MLEKITYKFTSDFSLQLDTKYVNFKKDDLISREDLIKLVGSESHLNYRLKCTTLKNNLAEVDSTESEETESVETESVETESVETESVETIFLVVEDLKIRNKTLFKANSKAKASELAEKFSISDLLKEKKIMETKTTNV
jgi:hypothetical protein